MATTKRNTKQANTDKPVAKLPVADEVLPKPATPMSFIDKLLFFLQLRDAYWSVPLFFFLALFFGWIINWATGWHEDFFPVNFIQPLAQAGAIVVGAFGISGFVLYFNFRHIQRYIYGKHKDKEGIIKNYSKWDWNENLTAAQRIGFALFCIFFPVVLVVVVYIKMIVTR